MTIPFWFNLRVRITLFQVFVGCLNTLVFRIIILVRVF